MLNTSKRLSNNNLSFSYQNKTIFLPSDRYNWQKFNCFHLADNIRLQVDLEPLPNLNYIWNALYLSECLAPKNLVSSLLFQNCHPGINLKDFNLLVLKVNDTENLGTFINNQVVFMGQEIATIQSINRVAQYVDSIWQYIPMF
jgi:hypothetical protein